MKVVFGGGERDSERVPAAPRIGGLMRATILGVIGLICVATMAGADIPGLDHVWTVPGAMQTPAGIGTFVACTNAGTSSNTIGVEMLGPHRAKHLRSA